MHGTRVIKPPATAAKRAESLVLSVAVLPEPSSEAVQISFLELLSWVSLAGLAKR
jgi:hypothetical protein